MPSSLELANKILREEKKLQTSYGQLEDMLSSRHSRIMENLIKLQARQVSLLNSLINDLEREQPPMPVERYYAQHILQIGETLPVLALEYNTTVSAIRRVNPGLPENPQPGQLINLPIEIPKPPANSFRYQVRPGDTLYNIARRFNTTVEILVRLNSIADPDIIFPGRLLVIPGPEYSAV